MRRGQQKQILEMLETLKETQGELIRFLRRLPEESELADFLSECQEFAAQIGEYIEGIEGEGTRTVALLSEYCELIYQASLHLNHTVIDAMRKKSEEIANSVKTELPPNRIEVLFLPYKYSMADSLQTIWETALGDPDCDTYICPIPYYDRKEDGSLGEMHYEGNLYSQNLPITDWRRYDIEARRPDIIFFHAPYDDGNYVTTVHPLFYASRLRDLTDCLVYVPYFVTCGAVPEHLCVVAGTLYADKVIVQSETARATYIKVFKDFLKENGLSNEFGYPEKKFIALGSPKMDKAVCAGSQEYAVPEEWSKFIDGEGCGRKKVILMNSSIPAILKYEEAYIERLRRIFDVFKMRKDVVLLWRPHPLLQATVRSMRPLLADLYEELIHDYICDDVGIYDDTGDFNRAVAMCDAYYGEWSSVVAVLWAARKPMMRQCRKFCVKNQDISADFSMAISDQLPGVRKVVLVENRKYALENFLDDITDDSKRKKILDYLDSQYEYIADLDYANMGCAGEMIYNQLKKYVLG